MLVNKILKNKQILNENTTTYPITLSDIKLKSQYFTQNATDTSKDLYIQNVVIPNVIKNWEQNTKYILLDKVLINFLELNEDYAIQIITDLDYLSVNCLNVREINSVKYYPWNWNNIDQKTILDPANYYFTNELLKTPKKFILKNNINDLSLFRIENNFQIEFKAGFLNNDFSTLKSEIKDCLSMQGAMIIDGLNGFCNDIYSEVITDCYNKFAINEPLIYFA